MRQVFNGSFFFALPTLFGEPVERRRKFMVLLKKKKFKWCEAVAT